MVQKFGDKLKQLRKAKGITQGELEKILNYSASTISGYETSERLPSIKDLKSICSYLETTPNELLCISETFNSSDKNYILVDKILNLTKHQENNKMIKNKSICSEIIFIISRLILLYHKINDKNNAI